MFFKEHHLLRRLLRSPLLARGVKSFERTVVLAEVIIDTPIRHAEPTRQVWYRSALSLVGHDYRRGISPVVFKSIKVSIVKSQP